MVKYCWVINMNVIPTIIKAIKEAAGSEEFRKAHIMEETAFTRNRKMNIVDIVMFILCNLKIGRFFIDSIMARLLVGVHPQCH